MINSKDVIRMLVPYPDISSGLALNAHMYICKDSIHPQYSYVKCVSFKPYMLTKNPHKHFIDEFPDLSRNPFLRQTRIDCDKLFITSSVQYADCMKTTTRPDICDELFSSVDTELMADGYIPISLNETELVSLNSGITFCI